MKTLLIFSLILAFSVQLTNAQEKTTKRRMYQAKVIKTDDTKLYGLLWDAENNALILSNSFNYLDYEAQNFKLVDIRAQEIEKINIKRTGSVSRSALAGFGVGFVAGAIIGFIDGDDPESAWFRTDAEEKAIGLGFSMGLICAAVGAIIGALPTSIPINGNLNQYRSNRTKLKSYAYRYQ